jgi:hypothetical protein
MKLISSIFILLLSNLSFAGAHKCVEYIPPSNAKVECKEKTGHVCHFSLPASLDGENINFIAVYGAKSVGDEELTFYFTPSFHIEQKLAKGVFSAKGKWDSITFEVNYSPKFCGPFFEQQIKLN